MMLEKSYVTLELPAVLEMLAAQAESELGKAAAKELQPSTNAEEVRRRLQETSDAARLMTLRGSPSFSGARDIRPALDRARLGGALNTRELLNIAELARCARLCKAYIAEEKNEKTSIDSLFHALRANKYLEERIFTAIPAEDEVADSASSDLAEIRRKMRAASARARDALNKILSSPSYAKALQEPIITMRSDRYVLPVRADHKSAVPGLVHDISSSGMTLFIEPMAAVKANNELRELAAKEKLEIERILAELSAECAEHADDFSEDCVLLVRLDLIFAKARLSYKMEASPAEISSRGINLRRARHPLLDPAKAVPIRSLTVSAVSSPIKRLCFSLIYRMIAWLKLSPAILTEFCTAIPPIVTTAASVVPAPMSTIMLPKGFNMSMPAPIAAAMGALARYTLRAPD